MAKITLNDITSAFDAKQVINDNNDAVETAMENTLSRDGTTPNQMESDLDLNSNDVNNVQNLRTSRLYINGSLVSTSSAILDGNHIQEFSGEDLTDSYTTLTGITSYTLGVDAIEVYINGVYQPPSTFTEIDVNTIQFTSSLLASDDITIVTHPVETISGADASNVSYSPAGGAVTNLADTLDGITDYVDSGGMQIFTHDTSENIYAGDGAAPVIEATATNNFVVGEDAAAALTTGDHNIIIGNDAAASANALDRNIVLGRNALNLVTGINTGNVIIGDNALGLTSEATKAHYNVAIGGNAGSYTGGSGNVLLGHGAGGHLEGSSAKNVMIGYKAGPTAFDEHDDKLYIHNDVSDTPLIGGDFDAGTVTINGDLDVTGSFGIASYSIGTSNPITLSKAADGQMDMTPGGTATYCTIGLTTYTGANLGYITANSGNGEIGIQDSGSHWVIRHTEDGSTEFYSHNQTLRATIASTGLVTAGSGFAIGSSSVNETELGILDGATVTTAQLNILADVTSSATEINKLDDLTGDILTSSGGVTLSGELGLEEYHETIASVAAAAIDVSSGSYFYKTLSGATTFTFTNPVDSGRLSSFTLELTNASTHITWPTSVHWNAGIEPELSTTGVDILVFHTRDGGTTWYGYIGGLAMSAP